MAHDMDISAMIITETFCLDPAYFHLVPGQATPYTELWLVQDVVIHQYDQQRGLLPAVCRTININKVHRTNSIISLSECESDAKPQSV